MKLMLLLPWTKSWICAGNFWVNLIQVWTVKFRKRWRSPDGSASNSPAGLAALSLMALVQLVSGQAWSTAARRSLRLHDISTEIERLYGVSYAENTRESIRRDVIAPLLALGALERNPDDPGLPGNSPHTHYAVSLAALKVIQAYGTAGWPLEIDFDDLITNQVQLPGL